MSPPEKRKEKSPVPPVAGERTWTLTTFIDGTAALGAFPSSASMMGIIQVVELSRLRAAEEERERLAEALEIFADEDNWTADAGMNDHPKQRPPLLYGHFQPWELAREVLASLEQKED